MEVECGMFADLSKGVWSAQSVNLMLGYLVIGITNDVARKP